MAALVIQKTDAPSTVYRIRNKQTTIGRGKLVGLVLPHISVSREHARVLFDPEQQSYTLLDLGSQNGTLVNGARVDRHELKHGDKVQVGKFVLL
ncbi:MAG: FHA domain-containing protein, partial [Myxococcota bacterium]|nr:FHA domain-containing protein [Myxococcota bacterium]